MVWRLDAAEHAAAWDSGEGAYRAGGRWNSRGVRAVYCSVDPAAAILEIAVHKGFVALDTVPHILTAVTIIEPGSVHVVAPELDPEPELGKARDPQRRPASLRRRPARPAQIRADAERRIDP